MSLPYLPMYVDDFEADTAHFLYAFSMSRQDALKIGVTQNPYERMRTLQTAAPRRLDCVGLWRFESRPEAERAERIAHHICSGNRLRGEWFSVKPCALSMASAAARFCGGVQQ